MNIHVLSGFLGSGKTTAIKQACRELMRSGKRVAVITNDQGSQLVDSLVFSKENVPYRQVGGGCFCCNYSQLHQHIHTLAGEHQPDHLFAESVGTCTDIVATVIKPLQQQCPPEHISFTTVADARLLKLMIQGQSGFSRDVGYIYFKQLEEAQVILVTKTDLVSPKDLEFCRSYIERHYAQCKVVEQNSLQENLGSPWLQMLHGAPANAPLSSLDIDYDVYARGEALLGYLDEHMVI